MSLRVRLLAAMLLLLALALGAVATFTDAALRVFLINRVDNQLLLTPPDLVDRLCDLATHVRTSAAPAPPPGTLPLPIMVGRLDSAGRNLPCDPTGLTRPLVLSPADRAVLTSNLHRPVELTDAPVRAFVRPRPAGGYQIVALSLDDLLATLRRLVVLELVIGAVTLGATAGVGIWAVRWGLRPLHRITGTARAIATELHPESHRPSKDQHVHHPDPPTTTATVANDTDTTEVAGSGLGRRVPLSAASSEVGQLAEAFNTMLGAIEVEVAGRQDSERRMRQFLADASHELRTPLTSLRGYAELIMLRERRAGVHRDPGSTDALRRITQEGARMSRLVEDLLMLARSDRATQDTPGIGQAVVFDQLVQDAVADLRAAHPQRAITARIETGLTVSGNRDQLFQILANLLSNAAIHTSGAIDVRAAPVDGAVMVTVADSGPGLTPEQASKVFDRFWRADPGRVRARGGSGLGLAIVRSLVTAHHGHIEFDTHLEDGTTVTVTLPAPA